MYCRHIYAALISALLLAMAARTPALAEGEKGIRSPELVASYLVLGGIAGYYQVYEKWPHSWKEVTATGIVSVYLYSDAGELIDPDDGRLEFFGDVRYEERRGLGDPEVTVAMDAQLLTPQVSRLTPPPTYREMFARAPSALRASLPSADDKPRLLQLAVLTLCREGLSRYASAHFNQPAPYWRTFLESPFAPLSVNSINPLTGNVYFGDGRANDLLYQFSDTNTSGYELLACDDNGPYRLPIELPTCPWQCGPRPQRPYPGAR